MKNPRFWIAVFVTGIVVNALDFVVQGMLLTNSFYSSIDSMRHDVGFGPFVLGDFVATFVLAWVLDRVAPAFAAGAKGGATAGFFLGVLVNFPMNHFIFLMFKGVPYSLAWINTLFGVVWYLIAGALLGALMKRAPAANAAAAAP
ncbi:MAG TPA: hypothetical protein VHE13_06660 [Opitutus sp.]|nr:hypothetical protein [Opitutus sp.]